MLIKRVSSPFTVRGLLGAVCAMGLFSCDIQTQEILPSSLGDIEDSVNEIAKKEEVKMEYREASCDAIYDAMVKAYGKPMKGPIPVYVAGVLLEVADATRTIMEVDGGDQNRFRAAILDTDDPVCFGIPDGRILLGRGLLESVVKNEAQLAAILAHECAHIAAEHVWKRLDKAFEETFWLQMGSELLSGGKLSERNIRKARETALKEVGLDSRGRKPLEFAYERREERQALEVAQDVLESLGYNVLDVVAMASTLRAVEAADAERKPVHNLSGQLLSRLEDRKFTPGRSGREPYEESVLARLGEQQR